MEVRAEFWGIRSAGQHSSMRWTCGFTLIELLVVIAIISLLVSILIPSLKLAKELSRRAVCGSNLHQMSLVLATYQVDHRGDFPDGAIQTSYTYFYWMSKSWKDGLYPKYLTNRHLPYCPSHWLSPDVVYAPDWPGGPLTFWDDANGTCTIGYVYTPNNHTPGLTEDLDGNVFPTTAEDAISTMTIMADVCMIVSPWSSTPSCRWAHQDGDPQGGNVLYGAGQVIWEAHHKQLLRAVDGLSGTEIYW